MIWKLIERSLAQRPLGSILTALSVALGVMLVSGILIVRQEMEDAYLRPGKGFSLVVGPRGSPLTLVLNTIFHVENSEGRLPFGLVEELRSERAAVKLAVPYAVGDTFRGFRVVATTDQVFDPAFPQPSGATVAEKFAAGGPFDFDPRSLDVVLAHLRREAAPSGLESLPVTRQAVVGAEVAETLKLGVGSLIEPTHGVEGSKAHAEIMTWEVMGVLKRTQTPIDRVVFINLDSFYRIPEHQGLGIMAGADGKLQLAISSIIVTPRAGVHGGILQGRLRARTDLMVANVNEVLIQLLSTVGNYQQALLAIAVLVVVVGVVSVMVAIYNTMNERRREIAILRAVGARRMTVLGCIVGEAALLTLIGALAGLLLGHVLVGMLGPLLERVAHFRPDPWRILPAELLAAGLVTIGGTLAGLVPAWKAYRTDVATHIAPLT